MHSHTHTNHKSLELSGATWTSKWPQSISAAVCVGVWVCALRGAAIEAMWYPGIICQFAMDRTEVREDRIMSGEHPQCIWRTEKVQSSDYTSIGEQRGVKMRQFPAVTWV